MAKLNINGQFVTVDDSFLKLSPDQQSATVDEIAKSLPARQGSTGSGVPAAPSKPEENIVQDVFRSVRGGIPFNDRISAAARMVTKGGSYGENLADERAKQADLAARHPVANFAGNLVGGAISTAPLLPMMPFASSAKAMLTAPSLTARVAEGAKLGAGYGAAQGLSDSPDLTDLKRDATGMAAGAAGGAALGGLIPIAGGILGAGASTIAGHMRPVEGMSGPAGRSMLRGVGKTSPDALGAELDRLGPDAMFADASPRMLGKTQGVFGNNDRAREIIAQELKNRGEGASDRLLGDVRTNYGPASPPRIEDARLKANLQSVDDTFFNKTVGLNPENPNLPDVDVSSILGHIEKQIPFAEGAEKSALLTLRDRLTQANPEYGSAVESLKTGARRAEDYMPDASESASDTIRNFVRGLGGVQDAGGDLKSREVNKEMVALLNKRGVPLDRAREAAAEAGFFDHIYGNPDEAVANSTVNDLIDAIEANARHPGNAENAWLRDLEERSGGRAGMWDNARGMASEANAAAKANLPPEKVAKTNPINLHKIKGEIDDLIEYPDRRALGVQSAEVARSQGAFKNIRQMLNERLKAEVPGYAEAVGESAEVRGQIDANRRGYNMFGGEGKGPLWPEELKADMDTMSVSQNEAHKSGARSRIEEKFRTTANDLTAGKTTVGGPNDFRRDLLSLRFGEEPTSNVLNAVERERTFADTSNRVTGNSATAERLAAMKDEAPAKIGSLRALVDALAKPVVERFKNDLPISSDYYPELAKILTARGPERDKYRSALVDALNKRKEVSQANNRRGTAAALGAALGIDEGARSLLLPAFDRRDRR